MAIMRTTSILFSLNIFPPISGVSPCDARHNLREPSAGIDRIERAGIPIRRRDLPHRSVTGRRRHTEEIHIVKYVQQLATEFEVYTFRDRHAFDDAHVEAHELRTTDEMIERRA